MQDTTLDIATITEKYVRHRFRVRDDDALFSPEVNLWENGYVDSAGVVEMIAFLEETFQVTLPEGVLFDPEFTCINGMARLIVRAKES